MRSKCYKDVCKIIRASITAGETHRTAYQRAGLGETTFYTWKKEKPDFAAMIKEAERTHRESKVAEAKVALHKAACGYETTEVRTEYGYDKKGNRILLKEIHTIKHYPPNVQACKEELHNFAPDEFGNTTVDDTTTGIKVEIVTQEKKDTLQTTKNSINETKSLH